jgi:hypothetical protein
VRDPLAINEVSETDVSFDESYLDLAFKRCLARSIVEYKQTNLSVAAKVAEVFTAPPSFGSFDYIFDLTGGSGDAYVFSTRIVF